MIYEKILKIFNQLLNIDLISSDASIRKLPVMRLLEVKSESNYDTQLLEYKLEIFGESSEEVRAVINKVNKKNIFEINDESNRFICTLKTEPGVQIEYKDHIFKATKNISVQVIQTRIAA